MEKFAGVGLTNLIIIWLMCMIFSIIAKTLVIKYNVPDSVRDVVTAS